MKKTGVLMAVILGCLVGAFVFAAPGDTVVYTTNTGDKYHKGSCSLLRRSKIETTLADAVLKGLGPCGRCKPPLLDRPKPQDTGGGE